jgi:hypothetical protein
MVGRLIPKVRLNRPYSETSPRFEPQFAVLQMTQTALQILKILSGTVAPKTPHQGPILGPLSKVKLERIQCHYRRLVRRRLCDFSLQIP